LFLAVLFGSLISVFHIVHHFRGVSVAARFTESECFALARERCSIGPYFVVGTARIAWYVYRKKAAFCKIHIIHLRRLHALHCKANWRAVKHYFCDS
jgi:hypothetical protein